MGRQACLHMETKRRRREYIPPGCQGLIKTDLVANRCGLCEPKFISVDSRTTLSKIQWSMDEVRSHDIFYAKKLLSCKWIELLFTTHFQIAWYRFSPYFIYGDKTSWCAHQCGWGRSMENYAWGWVEQLDRNFFNYLIYSSSINQTIVFFLLWKFYIFQ